MSARLRWLGAGCAQPQGGPVSLLCGSHTSDSEPFYGEAHSFAVYPLPAVRTRPPSRTSPLRVHVQRLGLGSGPQGSWGWDFIGVLCGCAGLYLGLGSVVGRRRGLGEGGLLQTHPHAARWAELRALCADGA